MEQIETRYNACDYLLTQTFERSHEFEGTHAAHNRNGWLLLQNAWEIEKLNVPPSQSE